MGYKENIAKMKAMSADDYFKSVLATPKHPTLYDFHHYLLNRQHTTGQAKSLALLQITDLYARISESKEAVKLLMRLEHTIRGMK